MTLTETGRFQGRFNNLTAMLRKGDLVYYIETARENEPHTVCAPDFEETGNTFPARILGVYAGPSEMELRLKFAPRALLSLWDYTRVREEDVPGLGIRIAGIRPGYGNAEVHVGSLCEIAIPGGIANRLLPALEEDRALALERIDETAMMGLIVGRYGILKRAIEGL